MLFSQALKTTSGLRAWYHPHTSPGQGCCRMVERKCLPQFAHFYLNCDWDETRWSFNMTYTFRSQWSAPLTFQCFIYMVGWWMEWHLLIALLAMFHHESTTDIPAMYYCNRASGLLWKWKDGIFLPHLCSIRLAVYVAAARSCQGLARLCHKEPVSVSLSVEVVNVGGGWTSANNSLNFSPANSTSRLPDLEKKKIS